jgi:polar amino acid transport system permease protein
MIWDWNVFWSLLSETKFLDATFTTVWLTMASEALGLVIGLFLALGLLARSAWLVAVAEVWVWLWRGTPVLVQLLVVYFGLPEIGIRPSVIVAGLLTLTLNESAFLAVLVKNSILGVPTGQIDAARVLGMDRGIRLRVVILPQAVRTFLPILGNQVNNMFKTSSLVSVVSVQELLAVTRAQVAESYRPFEAFAVATIYYLAICTLWNVVQGLIERRQDPTRIRARRSFLSLITGE